MIKSSFNRFLVLLLGLLTMCVTQVGGANVEETITLSNGSFDTDHITWSGTSCNIVQSKISGSTAVGSSYVSAPRVYKGHVLTFSAKEGYVIKAIKIGVSTTYYGVLNSGSSISSTTVTTTGVTPSYTSTSGGTHELTCSDLKTVYVYNVSNNSNLQLRISSLKVTYSEEGPACTDPATALSITSAATATVGTPLSLTSADGNGGTVTWSVTNGTGSATVEGSILNPTKDGTVTVKAHQDLNSGKCAQDAEKVVTISKQIATITLSEAGNESNVGGTRYVGDSYTLPSTTSASCGSKVLVGWSTVEIVTPGAKPISNYYEKGASVTLGATNMFYAVFATASAGGASTIVNFTGGTSSDLTALDYVSANGLGTDYAAGNAPYRVKLDGTGDYILLSLPSVPTSIAIDVKMLGGATASSIKLQECATSDGTFTDVETMSISGAQNDVIEFASTKTYSQKYIKLLFTKGSNVGLGKLVVEAGGTTYSNYTTTCGPATYTASVADGLINGSIKKR